MPLGAFFAPLASLQPRAALHRETATASRSGGSPPHNPQRTGSRPIPLAVDAPRPIPLSFRPDSAAVAQSQAARKPAHLSRRGILPDGSHPQISAMALSGAASCCRLASKPRRPKRSGSVSPSSKIRHRSWPVPTTIDLVDRGEVLTVLNTKDSWLLVSRGHAGWIEARQVLPLEKAVEALNAAAAQQPADARTRAGRRADLARRPTIRTKRSPKPAKPSGCRPNLPRPGLFARPPIGRRKILPRR